MLGPRDYLREHKRTRDTAWRGSKSMRFAAFYLNELKTFIWPFSTRIQQNIRKHTAFWLEHLNFFFTPPTYFSDYMFTQNSITETNQVLEIKWITIILWFHLVLSCHTWSQNNNLPTASFTYKLIFCWGWFNIDKYICNLREKNYLAYAKTIRTCKRKYSPIDNTFTYCINLKNQEFMFTVLQRTPIIISICTETHSIFPLASLPFLF